MPTRLDLLSTHATYDRETWGDYEALYKGGKAMKERARRFLVQNPQEPPDVYSERARIAHYRCYLGSIIDYFASYLVTAPIVVRAKETDADGAAVGEAISPDPFYGAFKEDCDAKDNDLLLFMKRRVVDALIKKRSWWLVELPQTEVAEGEVQSLADWKAKKLGEGHLCALDAEQVLDWDVDDEGKLNWARIYSCSERRFSPTSGAVTVTEKWEVFEATTVTVYALSYPKTQPPAADVEVPRIGSPAPHGFQEVPLLSIDLDDGLWIANRLASPQIEHYALSNGLGWAIRRTCYALGVLKRAEPNKDVDVMGIGYYLNLGKDDSFTWASPDGTPFSEIREAIKDEKDEIYRVVHSMALGVDNNAAAIGRSAESKVADSDVVRVILTALGGVVREAIERCYAMLSAARGDKYEWNIEGLDTFEEAQLAPLVEAITGILALNIPSATLKKELFGRVGIAAASSASQDVKDAIKAEIDEGVESEAALAKLMDQPPDDDDPVDPNDSGAAPEKLPADGAAKPTAKPAKGGKVPPKGTGKTTTVTVTV